jgi:hypothetical protein
VEDAGRRLEDHLPTAAGDDRPTTGAQVADDLGHRLMVDGVGQWLLRRRRRARRPARGVALAEHQQRDEPVQEHQTPLGIGESRRRHANAFAGQSDDGLVEIRHAQVTRDGLADLVALAAQLPGDRDDCHGAALLARLV